MRAFLFFFLILNIHNLFIIGRVTFQGKKKTQNNNNNMLFFVVILYYLLIYTKYKIFLVRVLNINLFGIEFLVSFVYFIYNIL